MSTPSEPSKTEPRHVGGVAVYDEGKGAPLIAIHGLPGSARDLRWLAPVASEGCRFIRIDMPGFGATPLAVDRSTSIEGRARLVLKTIDALQIDRCFVLGHSMGGPIAAKTAALLGARSLGVAFVASVGPRPHRFWRKNRGLIASVPYMRGPLFYVAEAILGPGFERSGFRGPFPRGTPVHTMRCVRAVDFADHTRTVQSLKAPSLVAYCDDDPLIEPKVAEELAAIAPAGPRLHFTDGKHNPQKAHAVELGRALIAWTKSD